MYTGSESFWKICKT